MILLNIKHRVTWCLENNVGNYLGNLRFSIDSLKDEISKAGLRNDRTDSLDFIKIRTFLMWKAFLGRWEEKWWLEESLYKISNKVLGSKIHKQCLKINEKASNTKLDQKNEQEFLPALGSKQMCWKDKEKKTHSASYFTAAVNTEVRSHYRPIGPNLQH